MGHHSDATKLAKALTERTGVKHSTQQNGPRISGVYKGDGEIQGLVATVTAHEITPLVPGITEVVNEIFAEQ